MLLAVGLLILDVVAVVFYLVRRNGLVILVVCDHIINRLLPLILPLDQIPIKLLFRLLIHHIIRIIIHILFLLYLLWMIDYHIRLKIKLRYIHC